MKKNQPTENNKAEYSPILYHVSPINNAKSIEENGLILQPNHSYISLSKNKYSWFDPKTTNHNKMCLFEVNVDNIEHEMYTFLPELDEIIVFGNISKDRIKRLI